MSAPDVQDDDIRHLTKTRDQDLYIGVVTAKDAEGRPVEVPLFTVIVHSPKFYQAIVENLLDIPIENGWEIEIAPDQRTLTDHVAEKMNLEAAPPTYHVRVQTRQSAVVELFDEKLTPLDDEKSKDADLSKIVGKKQEVPVYLFQSDKFHGESVKKFVARFRSLRQWMLVIRPAQEITMDTKWDERAPGELRFQSALGSASLLGPKKNRRGRRAEG